MNKKLLPIVVTLSLVLSFLLAIPASAMIPVSPPPEPVQAWNRTTAGDVTDIAVGDLNGDGKEDVVAIDNMLTATRYMRFQAMGRKIGNGQTTPMGGICCRGW